MTQSTSDPNLPNRRNQRSGPIVYPQFTTQMGRMNVEALVSTEGGAGITYMTTHPDITTQLFASKILRSREQRTFKSTQYSTESSTAAEMKEFDLSRGHLIQHLHPLGVFPAFMPIDNVQDDNGETWNGYAMYFAGVTIEDIKRIHPKDPLRSEKIRQLCPMTLENFILSLDKPLETPEVVDILTQMYTALGAVNKHGVLHYDPALNNILLKRYPDGKIKIFEVDFSVQETLRSPIFRTYEDHQTKGTKYDESMANRSFAEVGWLLATGAPSGIFDLYGTVDPRKWLVEYKKDRHSEQIQFQRDRGVTPPHKISGCSRELSDLLMSISTKTGENGSSPCFTAEYILDRLEHIESLARKSSVAQFSQQEVSLPELTRKIITSVRKKPLYTDASVDTNTFPWLVENQGKRLITISATDSPAIELVVHANDMFLFTGDTKYVDLAIKKGNEILQNEARLKENPSLAGALLGQTAYALFMLTGEKKYSDIVLRTADHITTSLLKRTAPDRLFCPHNYPDMDPSQNLTSTLYKVGNFLSNACRLSDTYVLPLEEFTRDLTRSVIQNGKLANVYQGCEEIAAAQSRIKEMRKSFSAEFNIAQSNSSIEFLAHTLALFSIASNNIRQVTRAVDVRTNLDEILLHFESALVRNNHRLPFDLYNPKLMGTVTPLTDDAIPMDMHAMAWAAYASACIEQARPEFARHTDELLKNILDPAHISVRQGLLRGYVYHSFDEVRRRYSTGFDADARLIRTLLIRSLCEQKKTEKIKILTQV